MNEPAEPSAEQCSANAAVDADGRQGTACWYPQMGGYVGKAVAAVDDDGHADVWVWHDGEFPFPGQDQLDEPFTHSPVLVHYCDPGQLIRFGEFLERLIPEALR